MVKQDILDILRLVNAINDIFCFVNICKLPDTASGGTEDNITIRVKAETIDVCREFFTCIFVCNTYEFIFQLDIEAR